MKKIIRIILLIIIAFFTLFGTIATINMILKNEQIKTLLYGNIFIVNIIAVCITVFIILGKKKKH